eukprot:TRINITY_DN3137_c0_g3_i3.p1 TRINITY_DN3137_c0_g3~~TRINITY_DN3137_c0_g3_i3.p1  ORF type:complete len:1932 (-),score=502.33 TRINITY_DN3137_c0_g3_i3:18-5813(-)
MKTAIQANRVATRFNLWKRAMASGLQKKKKDRGTQSSEDILAFVTSEYELSKCEEFIAAHQRNAEFRNLGLKSVLTLVDHELSEFTRSELLYSVSSALASGYTFRTEGTPHSITDVLKQQYWELIAKLITKIPLWKDRSIIFNVLNMRIQDRDRVHVIDTGIFSALVDHLQTPNITPDESRATWLLFSSLMTQCMQIDYSGELVSKRILRAKYILNAVLIPYLSDTLEKTAHMFEPLDAPIFNILGLIQLAYKSLPEEAKGHIISRRETGFLIESLAKVGSLRCRLLLVQILRLVLPAHPSDTINFTYNEKSCVQYFFDIVADSMIPATSIVAHPDFIPSELKSEKYEENSQLASELILLLQSLLKHKNWHALVKSVLMENLSNLDSVISYFDSVWEDTSFNAPDSITCEKLLRLMASLAISGGQGTILRPGAKANYQGETGYYLGYGNFIADDNTHKSVDERKIISCDKASVDLSDVVTVELAEKLLNLRDPVPSKKKSKKLKHRVNRYLFSKVRKLASQVCLNAFVQNNKLAAHYISTNQLPKLLNNVMETDFASSGTIETLIANIHFCEGRMDRKIEHISAVIGPQFLFVHGIGPLKFDLISGEEFKKNKTQIITEVVFPFGANADNTDFDMEVVIEDLVKDKVAVITYASSPEEVATEFLIKATGIEAAGAAGIIMNIDGLGEIEELKTTALNLGLNLPIFFVNSENLFNTVKANRIAFTIAEQGINRHDNIIASSESLESFASESLLEELRNAGDKGDELREIPSDKFSDIQEEEEPEKIPLTTDEGSPSCGAESAIPRPSDDEAVKENDNIVTLDDETSSLIRDRVISHPITTTLAKYYDMIAQDLKRQVLVKILSLWPEDEELSLEKIGSPESYANFVATYAQMEKPAAFFNSSSEDHPLFQYILFVNNLLVSSQNVDEFAKNLIIKTDSLLSSTDEDSKLAGMIIVKYVMLPNPEKFADYLPRFHLMILKKLWGNDLTDSRKFIVMSVLSALLNHFLIFDEYPRPSKAVMKNYTGTLKEHINLVSKDDGTMEKTYTQVLLEVLILADELNKLIKEDKNNNDSQFVKPELFSLVYSGSESPSSKLIAANSDDKTFARSLSPLTKLQNKPIGYFEAKIVNNAGDSYLTIGLSKDVEVPEDKMVGLFEGSIAYHADDGAVYRDNNKITAIAQASNDDVVGMGIDFDKGQVFFTVNGDILHRATYDITEPLYPSCALRTEGQHIEFNWGDSLSSKPFRYDTSSFVSEEVGDAEEKEFFTNLKALNKATSALIDEDCFAFGEEVINEMYRPAGNIETFETPHPYPDNFDQDWEYYYPGAEYVTITFDPQCRTENNYDYLQIFLEPGRVNCWPSADFKYTGRDDSQNWPTEPIRIPHNRLYFYFHSDGSNNDWGVSFTVEAPLNKEEMAQKESPISQISSFREWTLEKDFELVRIMNAVAEKNKIDRPWNTNMDDSIREYCAKPEFAERNLPVELFIKRIPVIKYINKLVQKSIPFLNMGRKSDHFSLSSKIRKLKPLIFSSLVTDYFYKTIQTTATTSGMPEMRVNRPRAARAVDDEDIANTLFGQVASQGRDNIEALRQNEKAWNTVFASEGSVDAGGPYRECFTQIATELQSPGHLLALCPNGKFSLGENREKYIPRPSFTSREQLDWYKFLGVLMGITLRTKGAFEVSLPSIIWKPLVGEQPTIDDLVAIDSLAIKTLDAIRNIDQQGVDADSFADLFFETFTTHLPDGSEVPICPGGENIDLTFENRHDYCDLVINTQMHAFDRQVAAMREGLSLIVPIRIIDGYFSWQQLELLVCGKTQMDVELLRSQTEYSDSLSSTDEHIQFFWRCIEEMEPEEHGLFLRFVWGRSRLPLTASGFTRKFKIESTYTEPYDNQLPQSATCFFSLKLPRYSTYEIMKAKLLYAIHNCIAIDADSDSVNRSDWE